jgi:hypothetical protein
VGVHEKQEAARTSASGSDQTRYCSYEGRNFPKDEFRIDRHWGEIHEKEPPHTTTGMVIAQGGSSVGRRPNLPGRQI